MTIKTLKVSVICPCFNHEKYINAFIKSVLDQTEQDFELIIIDDASTDSSIFEINKFDDNRIKLIKHEYNRGPNAALNTGFLAARGKYIVLTSGDDMLKCNHLENVVREFELNEKAGAIYYNAVPIDENGELRPEFEPIYTNKIGNRYEVLQKCLEHVNPLVSPGMAIRDRVANFLYPLDEGLLQTQDMLNHIRIALNFDILVSQERTSIYRVPSSASGISFATFASVKRTELEYECLFAEYLKIHEIDFLVKIFGDKAYKFGQPTVETIPYILGRIALEADNDPTKEWGYKTIMKFISTRERFDLLNRLYGFEFKTFINLVSEFKENKNGKKIKKYRASLRLVSIAFFLYIVISSYIIFK